MPNHRYRFRRRQRRLRVYFLPEQELFLISVLFFSVTIFTCIFTIPYETDRFGMVKWEVFRELLIHILVATGSVGAAGSCFLLVCEYLFNSNDTTVSTAFNYFEEARAPLQTETLKLLNNIITDIYILTEKLPKQSWQVINAVLNYFINIGGLFIGKILRCITLVNSHFPGGILGILNVLFVIILIIFWRRFRRLFKEYTKCTQDKEKLEIKLEESLLMLQVERQQLTQETQNFQKLKKELEKEKDEKLCGICQDQIKTIVLLPCHHLCLCGLCLNRKKWKKCPICRVRVQSNMDVYV